MKFSMRQILAYIYSHNHSSFIIQPYEVSFLFPVHDDDAAHDRHFLE